MLFGGGWAWLLALVAGPAVLLWLRRARHLPAGHLLAAALFLGYVAGVASFTLFPLRFDAEYRSRPAFDPAIVLDLFLLGNTQAMSRAQYAGNILLGIPFGLLVPFLGRWPLPRVVAAGLGFSLLIEALQWLATRLMIAFPSRAVDVNDVVLNTLGALVGVLGFAIVRTAYGRLCAGAAPMPPPLDHFHARLLPRGD